MANDTNADWDIAAPGNDDFVENGAKEIRLVRDATAVRLDKEHIDAAASSVGGEHIAGSAFPYYQASAPTTTPGGTALASTTDDGRIWIDSDTNQMFVWVSSAFTAEVLCTTSLTILGTDFFTADAGGRAPFADGIVNAAMIGTDAVTTVKIEDAAITSDKIAGAAVRSAEIANATIVTGDISATAGIVATQLANFGYTERDSYTGNGGVGANTIIGLSFQPDILLIWYEGRNETYLVMDNAGANDIVKVWNSGAIGGDFVGSLVMTSDGFIIGDTKGESTGEFNVLAATYNFIAFKMSH